MCISAPAKLGAAGSRLQSVSQLAGFWVITSPIGEKAWTGLGGSNCSKAMAFRAVSVVEAAGRRSIVFTAVPAAQILISLMQVVIFRMQTLKMPKNLSKW